MGTVSGPAQDDGNTWLEPKKTGKLEGNSLNVSLPKLKSGQLVSFRVDTTTDDVRLREQVIRAVEVR